MVLWLHNMQRCILGQNKMHSSRVSLKEPPSVITSHTARSEFRVLCRWDIPTKQGWSFHPQTWSTLSHKSSFWKYKHLLRRLGRTESKGTFPDYQGTAAGLVMYQNSQCRFQIKEVIWGIRGFQIFTGEQFIPTSWK